VLKRRAVQANPKLFSASISFLHLKDPLLQTSFPNESAKMKFPITAIAIFAGLVAAAPIANPGEEGVDGCDKRDLSGRCVLSWTKNYGEYDEKVKRSEESTEGVDGCDKRDLSSRCVLSWTKNYGEYDEQE
jgi:hypothetical protein